jgi:hypothetical protein
LLEALAVASAYLFQIRCLAQPPLQPAMIFSSMAACC